MIWGTKINDMLYSGDAAKIIASLKNHFNLRVMAEFKLHDILSTMENSLNKLVKDGSDTVTIHCSANFRPEDKTLLRYLAGIACLSSFTDLEIQRI
jgi:orotidine-5'-phosphate decarboxylase